MVFVFIFENQDAKSDRVKQLLKETEKYLQKLSSKLQDAKAIVRRFEMGVDDGRAVNIVEKNEVVNDNEDESDQAQARTYFVFFILNLYAVIGFFL